ncbi:MAG TPA: secondary thiamine-phosphate synthase enzyme YjbQ [Herpetosiphonaceae bacterium]
MLKRLQVQTHKQSEFVDITRQVQSVVREQGIQNGIVYVYCPHTTCGLTIQENADPGVQHDMLMLLSRIAPRTDPGYRHIEDNSASHLQASAMGFSQMVFVEDGQLVLGRWQAIYLAEFDGPRQRTVIVKVSTDSPEQ